MTAEEYQTEAERITPQLRQTALRYMGDTSLSEDIAQDVLQQTILRLRHIDGMEIGEIATLLHKEEAAVRQNLSRGRKTLRLWIIKKMKEEER